MTSYIHSKKRMLKFFSWSLFLIVLSWFLFFNVTGEQYTIVRWISYTAPWLVGILLILFFVSVIYKQITLAIFTLVLSLLLGYPYIPLFTASQPIKPSDDQDIIKVMTYSKMGRNHNIDSIADTILKQDPNILFMQEVSVSDVNALKQKLAPQYSRYSFFFDSHVGLIMSSFNILTHKVKGSKIPAIMIDTPKKNIRVWNVHLEKSYGSTDKQYEAIEKIAEQVEKEELPIIVAGDFNATSINYPCKLLKLQLKDAFEESGFGFGFTFPTPARRLGLLTPFIRIDHIFFSHHFNSLSSYVVADNGEADHYPVVALLTFKQ